MYPQSYKVSNFHSTKASVGDFPVTHIWFFTKKIYFGKDGDDDDDEDNYDDDDDDDDEISLTIYDCGQNHVFLADFRATKSIVLSIYS